MTAEKEPYVRPSWDEYFMTLATQVATRTTCLRRAVGGWRVDRVVPAHGNQQHVNASKRRKLLFLQLLAQVAQMRHALSLGLDDIDRVFPAKQTVLVVMEAVDRRHAEGGLLPAQAHRLGIAVVAVAVAAQHCVRRQLRQRKSRHRAGRIGIKNDGALRRFQQKTGMAVPGQFHHASPLFSSVYQSVRDAARFFS